MLVRLHDARLEPPLLHSSTTLGSMVFGLAMGLLQASLQVPSFSLSAKLIQIVLQFKRRRVSLHLKVLAEVGERRQSGFGPDRFVESWLETPKHVLNIQSRSLGLHALHRC